jgi:hypothetical protein
MAVLCWFIIQTQLFLFNSGFGFDRMLGAAVVSWPVCSSEKIYLSAWFCILEFAHVYFLSFIYNYYNILYINIFIYFTFTP